MGSFRKQALLLGFVALLSPALIYRSVIAETAPSIIKELVDLLDDLFNTMDLQAAKQVAQVRNDLPKIIQQETSDMQEPLDKHYQEMLDNLIERKNRTGYDGIDLVPNTKDLLLLVDKLTKATYENSYQTLVADGLAPYEERLTHILGTLMPEPTATPDPDVTPDPDNTPVATPTPRNTPCVVCSMSFNANSSIIRPNPNPTTPPNGGQAPPIVELVAGINYFKDQKAQIESGINKLRSYEVSGADDPFELQRRFENVQAQLATLTGEHIFVAAAVDGGINVLSRLIERAQEMQQRADHEYDLYEQAEADGLVEIANNMMQIDASERLTNLADFIGTIVGELEVARDSVIFNQGAVPGEMARQILTQIIPLATAKKNEALQLAQGKAAEVSQAAAASQEYWVKQLWFTRIHCTWEGRSANLIMGVYDLVDEYDALGKPDGLFTALNSDLWGELREHVLDKRDKLNANIQQRGEQIAQSVAAEINIPAGPPIKGITQSRFTGQCGQYADAPERSASTVMTLLGNGIGKSRSELRRASREIVRREAATGKKAKKKISAAKLKRLKKMNSDVNKSMKKYKKTLPAKLNQAYKKAHKIYPPYPFK
jgi:hypothetical protein